MTIPTTEHLSQISQILAARGSELADRNAARLERWQRRYFRDPVCAPQPAEPPKWPIVRASIVSDNVTKLPARKARGA